MHEDVSQLERVQKGITGLLLGLAGLSYEEGLVRLGTVCCIPWNKGGRGMNL